MFSAKAETITKHILKNRLPKGRRFLFFHSLPFKLWAKSIVMTGKEKQFTYLSILIIFLISSCASKKNSVTGDPRKDSTYIVEKNTTPTIDYDELTEGICSCTEEIIAFKKETRRLSDNNDYKGLVALESKADGVESKYASCMDQLKQKYEDETARREKVLLKLKVKCPEALSYYEK